MVESSLLTVFQKSYQDTDLTPLIRPEQLEKFGVEFGREALEQVKQLVEDNAARDAKIIFSGHRGCGKSTLLAEFGRSVSDRYFVVFFSIAETIEMSDVNHVNILFAIAVNFMLEAEREQIIISEKTKAALYRWFAKRTRIEVETPVKTELSIGFKFFELITGKLKSEASVRHEIRQEFENNITELVAKLNEIAAVIQDAAKKEVLVIIDDLDKLDLGVVKRIYQDHIKALFLPGFSIIFTVPVACLRDTQLLMTINTEAGDQKVLMPVPKLLTKNERRKATPSYEAEAIDTLCQILHKRISSEILAPHVAQKIVLNSGGVLRELMRIANRCCRICLRTIRRNPDKTDIQIDEIVLDEALQELRLEFETTLGKADYSILQTTYEKFLPEDPKAQPFLDLLHGLQVLEYRNGDVWYDIHPIVVDLLQRKGLIHANE
jgi:energy-coupling factor transporter ATP-binding protein EcfA2